MVTREEYLNALEIIDIYHRQTESSDSLDNVKIKDWDKLKRCSVRLQNVLLNYYDWNLKQKIEYMGDITRTNFLKQRNAGLAAWIEFCDISGIVADKHGIRIEP